MLLMNLPTLFLTSVFTSNAQVVDGAMLIEDKVPVVVFELLLLLVVVLKEEGEYWYPRRWMVGIAMEAGERRT
jgi:hypothetical protein